MNYKVDEKGLELITHYEGLHDGDLTRIGLQPKLCPAGIWTAGWGHAIVYNNKFLKGKENYELACSLFVDLTVQQANDLLLKDLQYYENQINSLNLNINQNQFNALVSFIYNVGFSAFLGSTLLKRIKTKTGSITEAFGMWNKCGGVALAGLTARRTTEANLFLTGVLTFNN